MRIKSWLTISPRACSPTELQRHTSIPGNSPDETGVVFFGRPHQGDGGTMCGRLAGGCGEPAGSAPAPPCGVGILEHDPGHRGAAVSGGCGGRVQAPSAPRAAGGGCRHQARPAPRGRAGCRENQGKVGGSCRWERLGHGDGSPEAIGCVMGYGIQSACDGSRPRYRHKPASIASSSCSETWP